MSFLAVREKYYNAPMSVMVWLLSQAHFMFLAALVQIAQTNRTNVRIGGIPLGSSTTFAKLWKPTFEDYLNEAVGKLYDPPISFNLEIITLTTAFNMVEENKIDFVFANPSLFVCLEAEYKVTAIATLNNKVGLGHSNLFGGVFMARANDNSIETLEDIRGKKIEASSILLMGSGQTQWMQMKTVGLDLLVDPAQVIFVGYDQSKIVNDVLAGSADIGLVRTGYLEDMVTAGRADPTHIKHINLRSDVPFPLPYATELYPEWPLAATAGVERDLRNRVVAALLQLNSSSPAVPISSSFPKE